MKPTNLIELCRLFQAEQVMVPLGYCQKHVGGYSALQAEVICDKEKMTRYFDSVCKLMTLRNMHCQHTVQTKTMKATNLMPDFCWMIRGDHRHSVNEELSFQNCLVVKKMVEK